MNQNEYELIKDCIAYGAPAVQNKLMAAFNEVVNNSNKLTMLEQEAAAKAKAAAEKEAAKNKKEVK